MWQAQRCAVLSPFYYAKKIKTMAENDYKINLALGTSFDPAGLEQAQEQLKKLKPADASATQAATEAERELTKAREESSPPYLPHLPASTSPPPSTRYRKNQDYPAFAR